MLFNKRKAMACLTGLLVLLIAATGTAYGADALAKARQLYSTKQYSAALTELNSQLKTSGGSTALQSAIYYLMGCCYYGAGQTEDAAGLFNTVVSKYPASQESSLATTMLGRLGRLPVSPTTSSDNSSEASANPAAMQNMLKALQSQLNKSRTLPVNGPQKSRIYYTTHDSAAGISFDVDVQIGGRPLKMVFDTGASTIALGKNHLAQMGLPPIPAGRKPDGNATGVGSNSSVPIWLVHYDIKVGDMEIKNCPMFVQDRLDTEPLLGQTFFNSFVYTIDYGSKCILLERRDMVAKNGGGNSAYDVPFTREGNELLVTAQINGKDYPMYFDTGAMMCAFSDKDMQKLGIQAPEDAAAGYARGISGLSKMVSFPVSKMKLGPIEKYDFRISVIENSAMGRPLLGQEFYAGWQYSIDPERNVIHFVRR
jgi:predicted aspartyl protease